MHCNNIIICFWNYYLFFSIYAWKGLDYIINGFNKLEPKTSIPLIFTILTAFIGLSAALITQSRVRKRTIEEAHKVRKVEIYNGLIEFVQTLMLSQKKQFTHLALTEDEVVLQISKIKTDLTLWASPSVLKAFHSFMHPEPADDPMAMLGLVDPLYSAMRKDIGLSNTGLDSKFFIKGAPRRFEWIR